MFGEEPGFHLTRGNDFDLVCFTGGTDVNPAMYGQNRHPYTHSPDIGRDQFEQDLYRNCQKRDIPMVGICRGAQFLTVMNGGKLFQHVNFHNTSHDALVRLPARDGEEEEQAESMVVTSSHHQMMDLRGVKNVDIIGWCPRRSDTYETGEGIQRKENWPEFDVEIAYFRRTRSLCHQPHPEWMSKDAPYRKFFFTTVREMMEGKL